MSRSNLMPLVTVAGLLLLGTVVGCDGTPKGFLRHTDDSGYSVAHPAKWRTTTEGSTSEVSVYRAIGPTTGNRRGSATMNVVTFPFEPGDELTTAPETARLMRQDLYTTPRLIGEDWTSVGGEPAYRCEYIGTANFPQGSIRLHTIWHYVVRSGRVYNLTLSVPVNRMDEIREVLEAIAESFTFES